MRPRGTNPASTQSVERALEILRSFDRTRPSRRVSEIGRELGISSSSASRLLYSLERHGFVERDARTGEYRLGLGLLPLGSHALNLDPVYQAAIPELGSIATEPDVAVNLAILRDDALFYLAVIESPPNLTPVSMTGERGALHSTAMGAVLLAGLDEAEREQVLARIDYPAFTVATTRTAAELRTKVLEAGRRGWAMDREETSVGRGCVAVPIRGASGRTVAAISVTGPVSAIMSPGQGDTLGSRLVELGHRVSRRLGHREGMAASRIIDGSLVATVGRPSGDGGRSPRRSPLAEVGSRDRV